MQETMVFLAHGNSVEHILSMLGGREPHAVVRVKAGSYAKCSCLVFFDREIFESYQRGALMAPPVTNVSTSIF